MGAQTPGGLLYLGLPALIDEVLDGVQSQLLGTPSAPGINALVAGGAQLQDGLESTIIPGANQIADGNATLADGLVTAADGATQIADGLPGSGGWHAADPNPVQASSRPRAQTSSQPLVGDCAGRLRIQVAQIEAIQQVGLSGSNIPVRPGNRSEHTDLRRLPTGACTGQQWCQQWSVFGLAALGLVVAGGAGVWAWRRHAAA